MIDLYSARRPRYRLHLFNDIPRISERHDRSRSLTRFSGLMSSNAILVCNIRVNGGEIIEWVVMDVELTGKA